MGTMVYYNTGALLALLAHIKSIRDGRINLTVNQETKGCMAFDEHGLSSVGDPSALSAMIANSPAELSFFLSKHGLCQQFPTLSKNGVGIASILNTTIHWPENVATSSVLSSTGSYQAVEVFNNFRLLGLANNGTLVQIRLDEEEWLWIATTKNQPGSPLALADLAYLIMDSNYWPKTKAYASVTIPIFQIDVCMSLDWLNCVRSIGNNEYIEKAIQFISLRTDTSDCCTDVQHTSSSFPFDEPYLAWITRQPNYADPLIVAYVDRDSWVASS